MLSPRQDVAKGRLHIRVTFLDTSRQPDTDMILS